jgi:6-pyruvoyltetrahydropterin/6-carboxytetrahydropterin synthase
LKPISFGKYFAGTPALRQSSMFTISRQFTFCYAHRLQKHTGKCAHLHGHNGTVRIELRNSQLNSQGMVADFIDVKNSIGKWIENTLDHRTILEEHDPLADILREHGEPVLALPVEPTAENLAQLIYVQAEKFGLPVCAVFVWETEKCAAEYRI